MPVTVVVGGQFGSEGKGKVAYFLALEEGSAAAVRVGGPNSGHTVIRPDGNPLALRQLPTASLIPSVMCVLPSGSYIHVPTLLQEIQTVGLPDDRLLIDPNAMVVTGEDIRAEQNSALRAAISSTASGTGAAVQRRISRSDGVGLARECHELKPFIEHSTPYLRQLLNTGRRVLVEGTQGYGLSLLHAKDYPYVTSRDTTAGACISEAGLSPLDVDRVVLVLRAFPIRVAGNSGPLPEEIDWGTLTRESGSRSELAEFTTVTGRLRRVARFDPEVVRAAVAANAPTDIVLNHLDYLPNQNTLVAQQFAAFVSDIIGIEIDYLGLGPDSLVPAISHEQLIGVR